MCCVNTTPTGGQSVSLLVGSELVSHGGGSGSSLDALGLFVLSFGTEEGAQVQGLALGLEGHGAHAGEQALGAADFLHGGTDLAVADDGLDEGVRIHAVLLGDGGEEVEDLTLGDLDVHGLGEHVEHHLVAQFLLDGFLGLGLLLLGGLLRIGGHVLELLLNHVGLHTLRHRNLQALFELGDEGVASLSGLATLGVLSGGLAETGSLVTTGTLPLLYAGAMLVDAVAALVFGLMYDKRGVRALVWSTLISAPFAVFVFMFDSVPMLLLGVALWGVGMGAQESILKAAVTSMVPKTSRDTGYDIFECSI